MTHLCSFTMLTSLFAFFLVASALRDHLFKNDQLFEGDNCTLSKGQGVCKRIQQCPEILNKLTQGERPEKTCGFYNFEPVVCCPRKSEPRPTRRPTRPPTTTESTVPLGPITIRLPYNITFPKHILDALTSSTQQMNLITTTESMTTQEAPKRSAPIDRGIGIKARDYCLLHSPKCFFFRKLVVGGTIANSKEFPHMTAVGYDGERGGEKGHLWLCGGTLITETFVLTAAHCLDSPSWGPPIRIRVGDLNLAKTNDDAKPQERSISRRIRHPQYKPPEVYHDIALLELENPIAFDEYVKPACLPFSADIRDQGLFLLTATGWGLQDWTDDKGSDDLMQVLLSVVDHKECNAKYSDGQVDAKLSKGIVNDWQMCAGQLGKDTCQGDSGGPLSTFNISGSPCVHTVLGVTSAGRLCGNIVPGIYTRVSNYIDWIENIVWANS